MGLYSDLYTPTVYKIISTAYSGNEYVTTDNKGKFVYTNNDEFVFINNDGTETTLSSLASYSGSAIYTSEVEFSSTEIHTGSTKTLLDTPETGYAYNILGIYVYFNKGSIDYATGNDYISIYREVDGVDTLFGNYHIQNNINSSESKMYRYESSSSLQSDLNTNYTVVCPAVADGDGTIKVIIHYIKYSIS